MGVYVPFSVADNFFSRNESALTVYHTLCRNTKSAVARLLPRVFILLILYPYFIFHMDGHFHIFLWMYRTFYSMLFVVSHSYDCVAARGWYMLGARSYHRGNRSLLYTLSYRVQERQENVHEGLALLLRVISETSARHAHLSSYTEQLDHHHTGNRNTSERAVSVYYGLRILVYPEIQRLRSHGSRHEGYSDESGKQ